MGHSATGPGYKLSKLGSDVLGRRIAFNVTLVLSAIFGLFVSLSPNFPILCCALLLLGTAVGVGMFVSVCKFTLLIYA